MTLIAKTLPAAKPATHAGTPATSHNSGAPLLQQVLSALAWNG